MLIEIRKAGFINKGAELMLHAVLRKMKGVYPEANFVMVPTSTHGSAPYARRAELGFLQKAWCWYYGVQWGNLAVLAPKKLRDVFGVVLDKEIDAVLDAAGFAYSDQWGLESAQELAASCKRWKKQGTKIILLPQAMGPFESPGLKKLILTVADNADLICPRDFVSYRYLTEAVGERQNIRMYPDFTNLVEGIVPEHFDIDNHRFCLVPNYRMIDKTPSDHSKAYLPFMIKCVRYLLEKKQQPFILIHEDDMDLTLAKQISEAVNRQLPIVHEKHPLKIKGIIGASFGTLCNRYHGLVSALSQGIPALGMGWSHKYKMLFDEYNFPDGLLDITSTDEDIYRKIDLILEQNSRDKLQSNLKNRSDELRRLSEEMWNQVIAVLNSAD